MHIFAWNTNPYTHKYRSRPMVTPLHRFPHTESTLIDPRARSDGPSSQATSWNNRPIQPSDVAEPECARNENEPLPSTDETRENTSTSFTIPSGNNTFPNNFNRFKMGGWNWGIWYCFIIVSALLVPAHLFLKQYSYRGELMGIFFVITIVFLVSFSVSMFHSKTRAILLHRLEMEEREFMAACAANAEHQQDLREAENVLSSSLENTNADRTLSSPSRSLRSSMSSPDLHLSTGIRRPGFRGAINGRRTFINRSMSQASRSSDTSPAWDPTGEPPPYEIALLLPAPEEVHERRCETPPPSYDIIQ